MYQKFWFQLLIGFVLVLAVFSQSEASSWNSNPWIQQALQAHGILQDASFSSSCGELKYPIFNGKSALRSLPDSCRSMIQRELKIHQDHNNKSKVALLLLLAGHLDAAHDVLLGTSLQNLEQAEYAATHRGQTNWSEQHPLSDLDDLLHSIIHRMEGSRLGEGGYAGYENALYWCTGGPKLYESPIASTAQKVTGLLGSVYRELCQCAVKQAPICVSRGIIAPAALQSHQGGFMTSMMVTRDRDEGGVHHSIIAGGGKRRTVFVPQKCWDPIVFCLLLLENESRRDASLQLELDYLMEKELELLVKYLLLF